jgi:hypothetical protein
MKITLESAAINGHELVITKKLFRIKIIVMPFLPKLTQQRLLQGLRQTIQLN